MLLRSDAEEAGAGARIRRRRRQEGRRSATEAEPPVAAFPAHWAPNDLKIYKGSRFPKAYEGGAFIAFHGSWNRAPGPQDGYNVVFQPMADGKPSGDYVVFADGFAGAQRSRAARPTARGLAVGPDGALLSPTTRRAVSGASPTTAIERGHRGRAGRRRSGKASPGAAPEGVHPDAGTARLRFRRDRRASRSRSARRFFTARSRAQPAPVAMAPTASARLSGGSQQRHVALGRRQPGGLTKTIKEGVPEPKEHPGAMPPMGGVELTDEQQKAVAGYVWSLGHKSEKK